MADVSLFRLYLLRATYALIAFGLGRDIWPVLINHTRPWPLMHGVAVCMLATVSALALIGLRYPLQMLPLIFFDMVWKAIWLIAIAWPLWSRNAIDADTMDTVYACLMGVIFPIVTPWRYVWANYVLKAGNRWR